ncbi:cyclin-J-like protein [Drosophila miranda]|uniref:cyclin-J-like protein n=1 Tax=Drosophila miranda TaxID=7229 RepID=UPI00143F3B77|nr:cyclin-J-like protein [Drosophila miranda]
MQVNEMATTTIEENAFALGKRDAPEQIQRDPERLWKTQWLTDYAQDIFVNMKEAEMRRRPILFNSMQLEERPKLLQLCQFAAQKYKLNRASVHLGIYYMDCMTDYYTICSEKLQLLALTCLHIAAQIEDNDASVPRYSELNRLIPDSLYNVFEYNVVERKVLASLNFELMRPTTVSFVEFFACSFLTRNDFANKAMLENNPSEQNDQSPLQLLLRLADCTLSITSFANARPSLLAAACIGAVRHLSGLKCWSQYLSKLTSYPEHEVEPLVGEIIKYYNWQQNSSVALNALPTYVNMGPSSADIINPNWSTPDSGVGDSMVIVKESVTEQYDITTVPVQKPAVPWSDLAGVVQEEPQEQAVFSQGELQIAAVYSQGELQEQAVFSQGELQIAAVYSQGELQEQAVFSQGELQIAAVFSQGELQEQTDLQYKEQPKQTTLQLNELALDSKEKAKKLDKEVIIKELERAFKRKRIDYDCQDEPQAKRLTD